MLIKDFKEYKNEKDSKKIEEFIQKANLDYELIKRQRIVQNMFSNDKRNILE